jgi:hypothetical protein
MTTAICMLSGCSKAQSSSSEKGEMLKDKNVLIVYSLNKHIQMKYILKFTTAFLLVLFYSCNNKPAEGTSKVGKAGIIFPQGDKNKNANFKGDVWVKSLVDADSLNEIAVGNAPGSGVISITGMHTIITD